MLDVGTKYRIAVKELIIEWTDYQSEFSGCIHCEACEDPLLNSEWFLNDYETSNIVFNENDQMDINDCYILSSRQVVKRHL